MKKTQILAFDFIKDTESFTKWLPATDGGRARVARDWLTARGLRFNHYAFTDAVDSIIERAFDNAPDWFEAQVAKETPLSTIVSTFQTAVA